MKAILTKILHTTNRRCTRIKAFDADSNNVIVGIESLPGKLSDEESHKFVAQKLADKMKW